MIKTFEEYKKINEFRTITTEDDFINKIDAYKESDIVVNDKVLLNKAKMDNFRGDLKIVKSSDTGKNVLIYRPSISISSKLAQLN